MNDDKVFAAYAFALIGGAAMVLTALLMAGIAHVPPAAMIVQEVGLGLLIRAAYKSIAGWNWADWSVTSDRIRETAETGGDMLTPPTADAMS